VFGPERKGVEQARVELLDDMESVKRRLETDTTGRFVFTNIGAGRYRIRVSAPGTDEREGAILMESIASLIEVNNQFYSGPELSMAMGAATSEARERLEETVKRADLRMYEAKRAHYRASPQERRGR